MTKPLTAAAVAKYRGGTNRRIIRDGGSRSLFLVVQMSGHKSWQMRFRRPSDNKPARLTLGPVDISGKELDSTPVVGQPLSLSAARQLAAAVLRDRATGTDVFAEHAAAKRRRRTKSAEAAANTFGAAARQFIEEHAKVRTRRWRETAKFLGLLYPRDGGEPTETKGGLAEHWADKPVTAIDGHDVYNCVDEAKRRGVPGLERRKRNAGLLSDARGRKMARTLSKMFGWLLQHRRITANPSVGVYVPPAPASRERVLTSAEIKSFWQACDKLDAPFGPPLKLLLLTGQRLSEVAGMRRDELDDATWTIPGSRTKNHKTHVVPLPPLARDILASVPLIEGSPLLFTTNALRPVSGWSKTKKRLDAAMLAIADPDAKIAPWRLHDLRRSCATGMADIGIAPHIIEAVLNHVSGSRAGVAGIYNRAQYTDEKRVALERWASHVEALVSGKAGKLLSMHGRGKRK